MQLILKGRMKSTVTDFFYFMLIMFDHINQLYEKEKSLLIDTILKYHLRKVSVKENPSKPFHQGNRVLRKTHQSLLLKEREC